MTANSPVLGGLRHVKYVPAPLFQPVEAEAQASFLVGGIEVRLSMADARSLMLALPNVLAEHSVALSFEPLTRVVA